MNLFIQWGHGSVQSDAFRRLLRALKAEYCGYLTFEPLSPYQIDNTQMEGLFADAPLSYYREASKNMPPLDGELIEKMRIHEPTAMAILNRWRRSLVGKGTYAELHEAYYALLRYCNGYLLKHNIELIVMYSTPHIPLAYFFYALSQVKHIPFAYQFLLPHIFPQHYGKIFKMSIETEDVNYQKRLEQNLATARNTSQEITLSPLLEAYYDNYTKKNEEIKRTVAVTQKSDIAARIRVILKRTNVYISQKRYQTLFKKALYEGSKKRQKRRLTNYEQKVSCLPAYEKPFIFYPLHLQPEATTLPGGGVFNDQLLAIRMLAASLPDDMELYIKEHPAYWVRSVDPDGMAEARSEAYYDEICSLRNVKLIRHDVDSLELTDRCTALVTVTGTAGVEALFKGKPVLVFGNQFYSRFPGVFHIRTNEECINAIEQVHDGVTMPTLRELRACIKTLEPIATRDATEYVKANLDKPEHQEMVREAAEEFVTVLLRFVRENYGLHVQE